MIYLAYDENDFIVGAFTDKQMALEWVSEVDGREVCEILNMDKTFATMSVEYNRKYEG